MRIARLPTNLTFSRVTTPEMDQFWEPDTGMNAASAPPKNDLPEWQVWRLRDFWIKGGEKMGHADGRRRVGVTLAIGFALISSLICANTTSASGTEWLQVGFDAAHDYFNPFETALSSTTVANVKLAYTQILGSSDPYANPPAVAGGTVYVTSHNRLFAFDEVSGARKWNATSCGPARLSAPAVAGGHVWAGQGKHLAMFDTQTGAVSCLPIQAGGYAVTVVGPTVFTIARGDLVALEAGTGGVTFRRQLTSGLSGPYFMTSNNDLYITALSGFIYRLDSSTGNVIWARQYGEQLCGATPASALIIASVCGGPLLAVDATSGDVVWRNNGISCEHGVEGGGFAPPSVAYGLAYQAHSVCGTWAFSVSTGRVAWRNGFVESYDFDTLTVANHLVYVTDGGCNTVALQANTGDEAAPSIPGPCIPVVVNGTILGLESYNNRERFDALKI